MKHLWVFWMPVKRTRGRLGWCRESWHASSRVPTRMRTQHNACRYEQTPYEEGTLQRLRTASEAGLKGAVGSTDHASSFPFLCFSLDIHRYGLHLRPINVSDIQCKFSSNSSTQHDIFLTSSPFYGFKRSQSLLNIALTLEKWGQVYSSVELDPLIDVWCKSIQHRKAKVCGHNESVGTICLSSPDADEHLGNEKQERLPKAQLFSVCKWSWAVQPFGLIGIEWELRHYLDDPMLNSSWTTLWGVGVRRIFTDTSATAIWWKLMVSGQTDDARI